MTGFGFSAGWKGLVLTHALCAEVMPVHGTLLTEVHRAVLGCVVAGCLAAAVELELLVLTLVPASLLTELRLMPYSTVAVSLGTEAELEVLLSSLVELVLALSMTLPSGLASVLDCGLAPDLTMLHAEVLALTLMATSLGCLDCTVRTGVAVGFLCGLCIVLTLLPALMLMTPALMMPVHEAALPVSHGGLFAALLAMAAAAVGVGYPSHGNDCQCNCNYNTFHNYIRERYLAE